MGRYKQKSDGKGSLNLIQTLINKHCHYSSVGCLTFSNGYKGALKVTFFL